MFFVDLAVMADENKPVFVGEHVTTFKIKISLCNNPDFGDVSLIRPIDEERLKVFSLSFYELRISPKKRYLRFKMNSHGGLCFY